MASTETRTQRVDSSLSPEESWAFFDDKAQAVIGISGEEFRRQWEAGEYDEIARESRHADLMYLALFLPRDR